MTKRKITAAVMLSLAMSLSGTALAAPADTAAEGDLAARIAAIEKQQQQLTKQLDALKKENQKLRKKATGVDSNKEAIADLKKEQERVKLHGFVRTQWEGRNDSKAEPWVNEKTNNRFHLNLEGDLKVNENWTGHFQIESNNRYARSTDYTGPNGGHSTNQNKINDKDWGTVQRVWLTGKLPNGLEVNVGRRWAFLGQQFSLLGATVNGIDATMPINKSGLRAGAFYYNMAEYDNADFSFWGPMVKGPVAKNLDVFLAYARVGGGDKETPYVAGDYSHGNWTGKNAFVLSAATNIARNLRLTADYVRTDADINAGRPDWNRVDKSNQSFLARLDYKWTNPDVVGSFAAFAGYHYVGRNGFIMSDENDGAIKQNSRGWSIGFRYVPWKRIVWETKYVISTNNMHQWNSWDESYNRRLLRTQLDFIF